MTVLLIIAIIVSIPLVGALFLTDEFSIEKEITINKPKQEVFNFIKIIRNSELYSKWVMADPNSKREFKGTDGTVGFVYAWDSENKQVGKGEQEITQVIEGEKINSALRFFKPFKGQAGSSMTTESVSAGQ